MNRRFRAAFLLAIAICLITGLPVLAQESGGEYTDERIISYHSDITVHGDSSMTVRETIKAIANGNQISHGIYRDFATRYKGKYGTQHVVGFNVLEVLKDGQPEPYHMESQKNGERVYIGSADVLLSPGIYTYVLTYKTDRQLGFFKDHDELYWNVTGNGWVFQIDEASATVTLPGGVPTGSLELDGYTGTQGSTAKDFTSYTDSHGRPAFRTNAPLGPYEGLTIVVPWPKGHVAEPTPAMKRAYFIRDNKNLLIGLVGLLVILLYYIAVWANVGRDPAKGTIIPLYEPPTGLSPAAMRHIRRMGYDNKAFAAALIDMAVKGLVKIEQSGGDYTITRTGTDVSSLPADEEIVSSHLLGTSNSIELTNTHHATIGGAISVFRKFLRGSYGKSYFTTNGAYLIPGIFMSIITIMGSAFAQSGAEAGAAGFITIWLGFWTFGVVALLTQVVRNWRTVISGGGNKTASCMGAGCLTLFSIPFVGGEIVAIYMLVSLGSPLFVAVVFILGVVNFIFFELLKAPTIEGRRKLDQIEGFRMYLSVAEKDTLAAISGPPRSVDLFEKYLPYALALDVEQAWAEKFSDVLERAGVEGRTYSPSWYSGPGWSTMGAGGFASSLGGAFSSAISSSSTPPGSSSGGGGGGGGGGSSGGGGGGGGGGGW